MAIEKSELIPIYNLFKDEDVDYAIHMHSASIWYIGILRDRKKLKSDAAWNIYRIHNTGKNIDIISLNGLAEHKWDDRETLFPFIPYTPIKSLLIDGVNEYVALSNLPSGFNALAENAFTVSCWYKLTAGSTAHPLISSLSNSADTLGWEMNVENNGKPYFLARAYAGTDQMLVRGTSVGGGFGVWEHLLLTKSIGKAGSTCLIYINGVAQPMQVLTDNWTTTLADDEAEFRIGERKNESGYFLDGNIAQLVTHNKEFSATEALEIYNGGKSIDPRYLSTVDNIVTLHSLGSNEADSAVDGETLIDEVGSSIATCKNTENTDLVEDIP